jgi:glycosyltransferase involved in cell wall biosynthesis
MRILIICDHFPPFAFGGDGVISKYISSGLALKGHEVIVVSTYRGTYRKNNERNIYRILTPKSSWLNRNFLEPLYFFNDIIYLKQVIKQFTPDIIYNLHQWGILASTINWLNKLPLPKVYRFGDEYLRLHYYKRNKESLNITQAIVNTQDLKNRLSQYVEGDIEIINNGVNLDYFPYFDHKLNDKNQIRLLYLGRIVEHKGVIITLHVLKEAFVRMPTVNFRLTLVGPWPDRNYHDIVLKYIQENDLIDRVIMTGFIEHEKISEIYHQHDICIFPSLQRDCNRTVEGCPNTILECWASGIPVIARLAPGQQELLKNFQTALTIESDNPNDYVSMIQQLFDMPDLVKKITKNAREIIEKDYSYQTMIEKTEKMLIKTKRIYDKHI